MNIICNRYNSQKVIEMTSAYGSKMKLHARWQVSVKDSLGNHYDYYFVSKPTRKQISKCVR